MVNLLKLENRPEDIILLAILFLKRLDGHVDQDGTNMCATCAINIVYLIIFVLFFLQRHRLTLEMKLYSDLKSHNFFFKQCNI